MKKPVLFATLMQAVAICSIGLLFSCSMEPSAHQSAEQQLADGWQIQQSAKVTAKGDSISLPRYKPEGWISAHVPSTVMGALADAGIYKDVFMGKNLETIPTEQFRTSWWYRKDFEVADSIPFTNAQIGFDGINYYANIWLNGKKVAGADSIKGAFHTWQLDVTRFLQKGRNVLAVEVLPPRPGDFYMGFVDWTPHPPDENMGIFRPVTLRLSGRVSVENIAVRTKVDLKTLADASVTVEAEVVNHSSSPVRTKVKGTIENIRFDQTVKLAPYEKKTISFEPARYSALNIKNPRLWWPYQYGEPNLYTLDIQAVAEGMESDHRKVTFGIREVADYLTPEGYRGYRVNGKNIQIRGGGWADDLFLRENEKNLEAQVQYVKLMNLNTIRLEGFWGSSRKLYDLCDKYGVLLMTGWSCQWEWKEYLGGKECDDFGGIKSPEDMKLVGGMFHDQVVMFRNHPSIYVWVVGSDKLPRPELEKAYYSELKTIDPTRPGLGACSTRKSEITGPTGVKMEGPYDYVTPNYWYLDTKHGGAYGFNTETGPGPQVPPIESLKKMIPADKLWPINDVWNYHCGRNEFNTLNRYINAMNNRYGRATSLDDFVKKAQLENYEAIRPMFEAFAVNKAKATGVVQWMLNAAWPKLYWQLYDYYLTPNGAFFGTQAGCKTLNIIYNYGDNNIYVTNDLYKPVKGATAEIRVFDLNSKEVLTQKVPFDIGENEAKKVFDMPALENITPVYFLSLRILQGDGSELSRNFYWLSTKPDVLDEAKSEWFVTPNSSFADFTALSKLAPAKIETAAAFNPSGNMQELRVNLKNSSNTLAFFIELKVKGKKSGQLVLPIQWQDNYISLLPGEERIITARFNTGDLQGDEPVFEMDGWNVKQ